MNVVTQQPIQDKAAEANHRLIRNLRLTAFVLVILGLPWALFPYVVYLELANDSVGIITIVTVSSIPGIIGLLLLILSFIYVNSSKIILILSISFGLIGLFINIFMIIPEYRSFVLS